MLALAPVNSGVRRRNDREAKLNVEFTEVEIKSSPPGSSAGWTPPNNSLNASGISSPFIREA